METVMNHQNEEFARLLAERAQLRAEQRARQLAHAAAYWAAAQSDALGQRKAA
jgi:DNA segregation ATPase FtsK/SpoIIIE-like protein